MSEAPEHWSPHCVVCARRGRTRKLDSGHVCNSCRHGLRVDLAAIVDAAALAAWIPDPYASREAIGSRTPPGSRPPFDLSHADPALVLVTPRAGCPPQDAQPLLVVLEDWCRIVREDRGLAPYGVATEGRTVTLSGTVAFLSGHLDWMCDEPTFAVEDFAEWVRRGLYALRSLDAGQERASGWRIPCPADSEEGPCGKRLSVAPGDLHGDVRCPKCGSEWTAQRLLLVALNDERVQVWGYAETIADALAIPARTLRDWAAKGQVERRGTLYDAGAAFRRRLTGRSA